MINEALLTERLREAQRSVPQDQNRSKQPAAPCISWSLDLILDLDSSRSLIQSGGFQQNQRFMFISPAAPIGNLL